MAENVHNSSGELKNEPIDVLGLGCIAVDDFLYVPSYPAPDTKVAIEHHRRRVGGLTAGALIAASRLGATCAYGGTLGDDELSAYCRRELESEGISLCLLQHRNNVRPIHSYIVVDQSQATRTIIYDKSGTVDLPEDWPDQEILKHVRVLMVDHYSMGAQIRAARFAQSRNIPVVADLERDNVENFDQLLELCNHLILSHDFARKLTGCNSPDHAARALWQDTRSLVAVTCGDRGLHYITREADNVVSVQFMRAFDVVPFDTTGCGDVFHGAYAACLSRGAEVRDCLCFASAAAAIKATRTGAERGPPTREAVELLLKTHES